MLPPPCWAEIDWSAPRDANRGCRRSRRSSRRGSRDPHGHHDEDHAPLTFALDDDAERDRERRTRTSTVRYSSTKFELRRVLERSTSAIRFCPWRSWRFSFSVLAFAFWPLTSSLSCSPSSLLSSSFSLLASSFVRLCLPFCLLASGFWLLTSACCFSPSSLLPSAFGSLDPSSLALSISLSLSRSLPAEQYSQDSAPDHHQQHVDLEEQRRRGDDTMTPPASS